MFKQWSLALCIGAFALTAGATGTATPAMAQPVATSAAVSPAVAQMVRQAIAKLSAKIHVDSITPAAMPGFYQVIASGQMVYISADGRYLLHGDLVDLAQGRSLSDVAWAGFRKAALAKLPVSQRIVFAPPNPKYTVTVFTDVNCGFCRALHDKIEAFNKAGIAVQYLAWPREGVTTTAGRPTPTYTEMVSVWCAKDRQAAFSAAMKGYAPRPATCTNPVGEQFNLGLSLGVDATPMIIGPDGRTLGGYVTPEQLLQELQQRG